jgi:hypothetical protein
MGSEIAWKRGELSGCRLGYREMLEDLIGCFSLRITPTAVTNVIITVPVATAHESGGTSGQRSELEKLTALMVRQTPSADGR